MLFAVGSAAILTVAPARADTIDGDWCSPTGARHLYIEGPQIVTPTGAMLDGNYTRHSFEYVAPDGEIEAGKTVAMRLVDDYTVIFYPGDAVEAEIWKRCARPGV